MLKPKYASFATDPALQCCREVALSSVEPTTSSGSSGVASDVYAHDRKFGQRLLDNVSVGSAPVGRVATRSGRRSSSGTDRLPVQS